MRDVFLPSFTVKVKATRIENTPLEAGMLLNTTGAILSS